MVQFTKTLPELPAEQRDDEAVARQLKFEEAPPTHLLAAEHAILITRLGPAVPDKLLLGSLRDGRLKVQVPISVECRKEEEHVVVEAVEFNEFGFGKNLSEALHDLQRAIAELYFTLEEEQDSLGPDLQNTWASLQQKIARKG